MCVSVSVSVSVFGGGGSHWVTSKVPPMGSTSNFDADVKNTAARHRCENGFSLSQLARVRKLHSTRCRADLRVQPLSLGDFATNPRLSRVTRCVEVFATNQWQITAGEFMAKVRVVAHCDTGLGRNPERQGRPWCEPDEVFTLGDARSFYGLTSTIPDWFNVKFDANVKKTTARYRM